MIIRQRLFGILVLLTSLSMAELGNESKRTFADETPDNARELFVPVEDLKTILESHSQHVFLEPLEYQELLAKAATTEAQLPPFSIAWKTSDYDIRTEGSLAIIRGRITFHMASSGVQDVPLNLKNIGLRFASLDGNPAPIAVTESGGMTLLVEGSGDHSLELEWVTTVKTIGAERELEWELPSSAAGLVTLRLPGDVELNSATVRTNPSELQNKDSAPSHGVISHGVISHGVISHGVISHGVINHGVINHGVINHGVINHGVLNRAYDSVADQTKFQTLQRPGRSVYRWSLNNRNSQQQQLVLSHCTIADEITETYERLYATFQMTVSKGTVDRFRIRVPADFEITEVAHAELFKWSMVGRGDDLALEVSLRRPIDGVSKLQIKAERTNSDLSNWNLPKFAVEEVVESTFVIAILPQVDLQTPSWSVSGLLPINAGRVVQAIDSQMLLSVAGEPELRALAAYYAPGSD